LAKATQEQFDRARSFFQDFYTPVTVIWVDSDRIKALFRMLEDRGLPAGADGKSRSCWLAYGYLLAMRDCGMIALHACDIVNYDRQLPTRTCHSTSVKATTHALPIECTGA
jgi:glucosyl-3-phosphoglycerate synthase